VNYVGIDLHKNSIVTCVMDQDRKILGRRTLACCQVQGIRAYFESLRPFQAVVEATASYEWLFELIEPAADKLVLAHPAKLRVIAESVKKTDRLDAQVLAEFLARDMVPTAYRPTKRQREHRTLVRHRQFLTGQVTAIKNKMRRFAADYNADRKDLFTPAGLESLARLELRDADRFALAQLWDEWEHLEGQLRDIKKELEEFAKKAPTAEAEARAVLRTIPGVGAVTVDVIVSELGDISRFKNARAVTAYAGLAPGVRQSAGKSKEMGITKQGSGLLRWALVEAAWRLVSRSSRWRVVYEGIKKRRGGKKAIVAVARRLLGVMVALLRSKRPYRLVA
jgi:transposase